MTAEQGYVCQKYHSIATRKQSNEVIADCSALVGSHALRRISFVLEFHPLC
jgi:hypothetical protein